MTISYPRELTAAHWKTKRSRLVAADDLETMLVKLERQHKAIDQSKFHVSGYRGLDDLAAVIDAAQVAETSFQRVVPPHQLMLKKTQELAAKTADRLIRAKTVPKSDIVLVRDIQKGCEAQRKAWAEPARNGLGSFEKLRKSLTAAALALQKKIDQEVALLTAAMKATKSWPTVPYWIVGKDPRLASRPIGDRSIEATCKRLAKLLRSQRGLQAAERELSKFADDYPRKQKRVRVADPKLQAADPHQYDQLLQAEQAAVKTCLGDLARVLSRLKPIKVPGLSR